MKTICPLPNSMPCYRFIVGAQLHGRRKIMDKRLILYTAAAALAGVGLSQMLSRPVIAQSFGQAGNSNGVSATAPNAAGVSHAWTVDLRTNTVVMCRGDAAGKVACTQALMPGAANIQR
jgi:hypothetical protein